MTGTPRPDDIPEVQDDEGLIRHLDPRYHWDHNNSRPSTGAFRSAELSVDREGMRPYEVSRTLRPEGFGFARLAVRVPRNQLGLRVEKDPIVPLPQMIFEPPPDLDKYNPGHAHILGATAKSTAKTMRDAAEVLQTCMGEENIEQQAADGDGH